MCILNTRFLKKNGLFVVYLQKETGDMTECINRFNHHLKYAFLCLPARVCALSGLFGAMGHLASKTAVLVRKNAIFGSGKCVFIEKRRFVLFFIRTYHLLLPPHKI